MRGIEWQGPLNGMQAGTAMRGIQAPGEKMPQDRVDSLASISYPDCATGPGDLLQLWLRGRSWRCRIRRPMILLGGLQLPEDRVIVGLVEAACFVELSLCLFSAAH